MASVKLSVEPEGFGSDPRDQRLFGEKEASVMVSKLIDKVSL